MNSSQCQDARHETPHQLPCDCCAEHCDPQECVEIEEDQAMNTQDDTISRGELTEPMKRVVEITRAALVDKLVDRRMDDFDSHDHATRISGENHSREWGGRSELLQQLP